MAEGKLSAAAGWNLTGAIRRLVRKELAAAERAKYGTATFVRRDSDGTAWVMMPGASAETVVNGTEVADAQPGQSVTWRLEGGRLSITGNATSPAVGQTYVRETVSTAQSSALEAIDVLSNLLGGKISDVVRNIIDIINNAADSGIIDTSKLNLSSYSTTSQVSTLISNAISSAFDLLDSNSYVYKLVNNVIEPAIDIAISVAEGVLNSNIESAISAIDVGGANLLNNTQWESASDLKTATSLTEGKWYKDSYATVTYSSGMLVVSTSRTSGHYGCTQMVAVEPSTKYVVSAGVGSTYHIGIGSGTSPDDDGGWVEDGKRVWKAYETGANQAYAYVRMYAEGGGTPSPCVVNRVKLEKATMPSDYSPSNADTSDAVSEAARSATDFISVRDGVTYMEASSIELVSDYGVFASSEFGATQRVDLTSIPQVKCGVVGQTISVPGNSYKEYEVTNAFSYPSPPIVVPCFNSTSTGATFGGLSIAVSSVTTTGFNVRIYNSTTTDRSPGFYWIAVGSYPSA